MKNFFSAISNVLNTKSHDNHSFEFVTQILEPTGGKIAKPKDWFYVEGHRAPVYMWTISREDSSKGRYITGVRIQIFPDVKTGTGKTAKEFVSDFLTSKKMEVSKVIKICDEQKQTLFTRTCLEVEEGADHVVYSLFWDNNIDIAIFVIAGTTKELWNIYAPVFEKMSNFELIDMKRFEGQNQNA